MAENPTDRFKWPDETGPWEISLEWGYNIAGRLDIASFGISVVGDEPITASVLRSVPLGRLVNERRQRYLEWFESEVQSLDEIRPLDKESLAKVAEFRKQHADPHRPGPRGKPADHYRQVAQTYAEAWQRRERPTKAVADRFIVSHATAAKWVGKARKLGFLNPTQKGRAGGIPMTLKGNLFASKPTFPTGTLKGDE